LVPFRLQFECIQRALLAGKINIYFTEQGKANTNQAVDKLKHRQSRIDGGFRDEALDL